MSARVKPLQCSLCNREPHAGWDHVVGYPQRFAVACEVEMSHWLRTTGRTRAEAVRLWNGLMGAGR